MTKTREFTAQLREHNPPLFPGKVWKPELSSAIESSALPDAVRAGLLLWNDDLHASHTISQNIDGPTGSFWHAIMHRREGDASNSAYWWRRTGAHPAFDAVNERVLSVLDSEDSAAAKSFAAQLRSSGTWQPIAFVQQCEAARDSDDSGWLQRLQVAEIEALLEWCAERDL